METLRRFHLTLIGQFAYFSHSHAEHGSLFLCSLETGEVPSVLSNFASPPSEVRKISTYDTKIVLTDRKVKQVKIYDPAKDSVKVLLGPRTLVHLRTCKAYAR